MSRISRFVITLALVGTCLICGCGSGTGTTYPVVVFSDVHFNPFYDATLFQSLNAAAASEWNGIFQTSSVSAPSTYGADSNYPLLVLALSSIEQNLGTSPLVIFTGDVLGHNFASQYFTLSGSQDVAAMQGFANKTVSFFTEFVKSYVGDIPVMFVLGNADSYTGLAPDSTYFANTADIYYSNWIDSTADHQTFLDTYDAGGYYSAEPIPGVVVVALNTVALSTLVLENDDVQVQAELAWLESTLASARSAGKSVWLLMHVPPGAYTIQTANGLDSQRHLSSASMTLKPGYQEGFLQIVSRYPDIITMILGAHTHMDEFRMLSSDGFLEITPGITPYFNNNPAYKIFTFPSGGFEPIDYRSLNYNLTTLTSQLNAYYTFSRSYFNGLAQGSLNEDLLRLYPMLYTDDTKQSLYRTYYYSGNDAMNTITDANWKVYWCALTDMTETDLINCVNSL